MDASRITAAVWPWGTQQREQIELAAKEVSEIGYKSFETVRSAIRTFDLDLKAYKEVLDKYDLTPVSIYYHIPNQGREEEVFSNLEKELEFVAKLGIKRISLQASYGRPEVMDEAALDFELNVVKRFAEKSLEFGIMSNLHPHHNTWVMYKNEIDNILRNLDSKTIQFAPDTAHLTAGNCDPVAVIKEYADRVNFTHFKDIKSAEVQSEGLAKAGMEVYSNFCELGQGNVDFKGVFDVLKSVNYDGPLCEELDRAPVSNVESARNNYNYLLNNY
jgi:inosose dehydratase